MGVAKRKTAPKKQKLTRTQEVSALHRIAEVIQTVDVLAVALQDIAREISVATKYPLVAIEFFNVQDRTLTLKGSVGLNPVPDPQSRIPVHQTVSGTVIQTSQPFLGEIPQVDSDEFWRSHGAQSIATFPLVVGKQTLGALTFAHRELTQMDANLQKWAFSAAAMIGAFIQTGLYSTSEKNKEELTQTPLLQTTLHRIAESARTADDLDSFYASVHRLVNELMPSSGFYVATYRKAQQSLFFHYFHDEQNLKPSKRQAEDKPRIDLILSSGTPIVEEKWIGVPMNIHGSDAGVLVVYSNTATYGAREKEILTIASLQIAGVMERKETEEILRSHTTNDELTHLPNSALFRSLLNQAIARARRTKENMAVVYLDLDHFKSVRKDVGTVQGQNIIRQVAERLRRNVREGDTIARWGDDRFMWLISNMKRMDDVAILAEKMLAIVNRPLFLDGKEYILSTSIGISVFPFDGADSETLIRVAETALIRAKELGGNAYQFYAEEVNTRVQEELILKRQLYESLHRHEFVVHYQPVMDEAGKIASVEALVRWRSPNGNLIYPGQFLVQSEDTGLIAPLDEYVISTACAQVKAWNLPGLRLVANVSDYLFHQEEDLSPKIQAILEASGLPAELLELELKESSVAENPEDAILKIQKLRDMGVHVSIGDFGTAGLSFHFLKRFTGLAVDSSVVRDSSFRAVVALAHGLKLRVTAKGIESEADLALVKSEHCEYYQGSIFSLPVPAQECEQLLRKKEEPLRTRRVPKKALETDYLPWPVQAAVIDLPAVKVLAEVGEIRRAAEPVPIRLPETISDTTPYPITCFNCQERFNVLEAEWCSCLVSERTFVCPACKKCFCKSKLQFKLSFWTDAPQSVWDRRIRDEKELDELEPNPTPDKVSRPLILIVDDEAPILRTAIRAIKGMGYDAVHAADGAQGLKFARLYVPNLILSDALMPKMDGREMCRQIKNDPFMADMKVVIMTSLSARAKDRSGAFREFKVDDYLQKPLEYDTLRSILQRFL